MERIPDLYFSVGRVSHTLLPPPSGKEVLTTTQAVLGCSSIQLRRWEGATSLKGLVRRQSQELGVQPQPRWGARDPQ